MNHNNAKSFYSLYLDEQEKLTMVYFDIMQLPEPERKISYPAGRIIKSFVSIPQQALTKVYFVIEVDSEWQLAMEKSDGTLTLFKKNALFLNWLTETVVAAFEDLPNGQASGSRFNIFSGGLDH